MARPYPRDEYKVLEAKLARVETERDAALLREHESNDRHYQENKRHAAQIVAFRDAVEPILELDDWTKEPSIHIGKYITAFAMRCAEMRRVYDATTEKCDNEDQEDAPGTEQE